MDGHPQAGSHPLLTVIGVGDHALDRGSQRLRRAFDAGDRAPACEVVQTADARSDHRHASRSRLDRRQRLAFIARGHEQHIHLPQRLSSRDETGEMHAQLKFCCAEFGMFALRPVTAHQALHRSTMRQQSERLQEQIDILDRHEAAEEADHRRPAAQGGRPGHVRLGADW